MNRFEGKVAIITGASTGLGPVMAQDDGGRGRKLVLAARKGHCARKWRTRSARTPSA